MDKNKHRILKFNFEDIPNECKPERWWIQGLLPKERLVLLAAQGGTGKTSLAVYLSKYLAENYGTRVIYWAFEDDKDDFARKTGGAVPGLRILTGIETERGEEYDFDIRNYDDFANLNNMLVNEGIDLLVIDPISALLDGDSNDNQVVRKMLNRLRNLAENTGATILGIHHFRKQGASASVRNNIIGASAWVDTPRHVLSLVKNDVGQRFLEVSKSNIAEVGTSWEVFMERQKNGYAVTGLSFAEVGAAQKALEEPRKKRENPTIKALKSEFGIGKAFTLTDVKEAGAISSFYSWLKRHQGEYQELEKDGKKAWIFV